MPSQLLFTPARTLRQAFLLGCCILSSVGTEAARVDCLQRSEMRELMRRYDITEVSYENSSLEIRFSEGQVGQAASVNGGLPRNGALETTRTMHLPSASCQDLIDATTLVAAVRADSMAKMASIARGAVMDSIAATAKAEDFGFAGQMKEIRVRVEEPRWLVGF